MVHNSQQAKGGAAKTSQEERLKRRVFLQIFPSKASRTGLGTCIARAGRLESEGAHGKNRLHNDKLGTNTPYVGKQ